MAAETSLSFEEYIQSAAGQRRLLELRVRHRRFEDRVYLCVLALQRMPEVPVREKLERYPEKLRHHGVAVLHEAAQRVMESRRGGELLKTGFAGGKRRTGNQ